MKDKELEKIRKENKLCEHCRKLIQKRIDYLEDLDKRGICRDTTTDHSRRVALQQLKHLLVTEFDYDDLEGKTEVEVIKQEIISQLKK